MYRLRLPLMIINTKSYKEALLPDGLLLGRIAEQVAEELGINIVLAVQPTDIYVLSSRLNIPIIAQHFDPVESRATGSISGLAIKQAGARGSLINHSEKRLALNSIEKRIKYANLLGIDSIVCASSLEEAKKIARLDPSMIAIEPPELIAGNISVSSARPELLIGVVDSVKKINHNIPVLCGAGIKTGRDVARARDLGVKGILVSSGIVLARDWDKAIRELASNL